MSHTSGGRFEFEMEVPSGADGCLAAWVYGDWCTTEMRHGMWLKRMSGCGLVAWVVGA